MTAAAYFNIREDLETRPLAQRVEILFTTGPHTGDVAFVARALALDVDAVQAIIDEHGFVAPAAPSWWRGA